MKTSKIQCGYRSNDIYTGEDYLIHDIIECQLLLLNLTGLK